jgi:hypothetical protein
MKPVSPVDLGYPFKEVIFAKYQSQYIPLPAVEEQDGTVHTRWHLSFIERIRVLLDGDIYLSLKTFYQPLQPVRLSTKSILQSRRETKEWT